MKKIALVGATLALVLATGSAFAANSLNTGAKGFNVNTEDNFIINGKYFISKDTAVLGGLGLRIAGGDASGTDLGLLAGMRKYMKTDDFAPFVGGRFEYTTTNDSTTTSLGISAEAGAEYFLAKQFSLEGRVGFGYFSDEVETTTITGFGSFTSKAKTTYIGTGTASLSANFYF